jgi:hypothetical protein
MSFASYYRRLKELPWRDRALLGETTATLAVASFAIRALPFRKVVRMAVRQVPVREASPALHKAEIDRAGWAVEACARVLPWRIVCFQKGLAMQWMLQRRGVRTTLHYGVAQNPSLGLVAHVWVTHRGEVIIGGEEAPNFACLATFPIAEGKEHEEPGPANASASRERPGG